MKKTMVLLAAMLALTCSDCFARGGFSSAGRGGFSSSRGFSTSRSFSSPSRSYSSPGRSTTSVARGATTTRTVTTTRTRSYGSPSYYGAYGHPMMFGPFGIGYGYSNGLVTGMILGNLMHPQGTVVYTGGGYAGNALLYPDGRVVNQDGYQVGTYGNGHFTPMNGGLVAQPAPPPVEEAAQPVSIGYTAEDVAAAVAAAVLFVLIVIAILA